MTYGTLYVNRPLENAQELIAWAKAQGFKTTLPAEDMHVTVVYSKTPLAWPSRKTDQITVDNKSGRAVQTLGDEGAIVLRFKDKALQDRNKELLDLGAKSDYDSYIPHVTVSYNGEGVDLNTVEPYTGPLVFDAEVMKPVEEDWKDKLVEKEAQNIQGALHLDRNLTMPLSPGKDESEDDFIGRCMSAEKASFPDQKQRLAVCYSMLRENRAEKAFNPNQPREPKGTETGGQWSDGDGGAADGKELSDDDLKNAAQSVLSDFRSQGGRSFDAPFKNGAGWQVGVRYFGDWEVPQDEDDDGDYDWKVPTDKTAAKVQGIVDAFQRKNPNMKVIWSAEEKEWISIWVGRNKMNKNFAKGKIAKVDEGLGLVFGWAIVCKVDGEPYFDLQGDYVPEEAMLNATCDFMVNSRLAKEMHNGPAKGAVLFSFPLTEDIAKAMGIASTYTGWMVAMKPDDPGLLKKFREGIYTGFSIGGSRIRDKELD